MTSGGDYNDNLDGDSLACKPGHTAEGLDNICSIGMPIAGSLFFVNGLWLIYLVRLQRNHRKCVDKGKDNVRFSYIEKLLLSMGVAGIGTSLTVLVYGSGTMYPTTHIRGKIGDIAIATANAVGWYVSLLQHRGAIYFKYSIPQPQGSLRHLNKPGSLCHLLLLSHVLDILQSWLSPVIAFMFWSMLRAGVYSRGWFLFCMASMQVLCGLRSFISAVFQRFATLKLLAGMISAKQGTRDEIDRRRGFMRSKTIALVIDLSVALFTSVLTPASYLVLGAPFNSKHFAVHMVVVCAIYALLQTLSNIYLYLKFNKLRRNSGLYLTNKTWKKSFKIKINARVGPSPPEGKSLPSGMSVVEQSDDK